MVSAGSFLPKARNSYCKEAQVEAQSRDQEHEVTECGP